jgi:hypothetical protein
LQARCLRYIFVVIAHARDRTHNNENGRARELC